jgi:hypothetical protein
MSDAVYAAGVLLLITGIVAFALAWIVKKDKDDD